MSDSSTPVKAWKDQGMVALIAFADSITVDYRTQYLRAASGRVPMLEGHVLFHQNILYTTICSNYGQESCQGQLAMAIADGAFRYAIRVSRVSLEATLPQLSREQILTIARSFRKASEIVRPIMGGHTIPGTYHPTPEQDKIAQTGFRELSDWIFSMAPSRSK